MRVISGTAKGRKLFSSSGLKTRPTSDRVKEALFNILASKTDFEALQTVDICAGSGALGIEALSRGAEKAVFIEDNREAINAIRKNLELTSLVSKSEIMQGDARNIIIKLSKNNNFFDLIFFDPPYRSNLYETILKTVSERKMLSENGIMVVESDTKMVDFREIPDNLMQIDSRSYGDTRLSFFQLKGD